MSSLAADMYLCSRVNYKPGFYRIKERFAYVRNLMNTHQIIKVGISLEVVDRIFLDENPNSMMNRLEELAGYLT